MYYTDGFFRGQQLILEIFTIGKEYGNLFLTFTFYSNHLLAHRYSVIVGKQN